MTIKNEILFDMLDECDVAKDRTHHLSAAYYASKYGDYKNACWAFKQKCTKQVYRIP